MFTKMKKILIFGTLAGVISLAAAGCSKDGGSGAGTSRSFTYWMAQGEDTSYYANYDENPSVEYLLSRDYKGQDGKEDKVDIEFLIPATGSAENNLTTSISTGDYADIMDMSLYKGSVLDLYKDGIIMDLTQYVEDYMPNYRKFLEERPDLKMTATNIVDGERKYIKLYTYIKDTQNMDQWCGFMYRRDWIVKYGTNPDDGSTFSGEYTVKNDDGSWDVTSWVDNVVFPSGGTDPVYISDWEWMLEIFKKAIDEQGIDDGYPMSLPYGGFHGMGDLVCAFGGGSPSWYKDQNNTIQYGLNSDDFRVYLQVMNGWYQKGWIDTAFPEHSNDMFYKIDDSKVRQGKVGLWHGILSQLIGKSEGDGFAEGAVAFAARQPINDLYGTAEQKNVIPYTFYQMSLEGGPIVITDKAEDKDLVALFTFLDYQFSDEAMLLKRMGLNKEQYEATQNELYTKHGLTEGAYTVTVNEEGIKEVEFVDTLKNDTGLEQAARANRFFGVDSVPDGYRKVNNDETETWKHSMQEWLAFESKWLSPSFFGQLSAEDSAVYNKINNNINEFSQKNVPNFIKGTSDPSNDKDWESFKKALGKYKPETVTEMLQTLLEELTQ